MATAIVIGNATQVSFNGACVLSANWGYNPNPQRLYCIGSWSPEYTFYRPTQTLNLTIYSPGPTYDTSPTDGCEDANGLSASVSPADCGGSVGGDVDGTWLVTSYSYSKEDATQPGQESWSLIKYKNVTLPVGAVEPTYVLRSISEGQSSGNETGIVFNGTTVESTTGSVSANSFGRASTLELGVVSQVGGGSSTAGDLGQGSASIPYTPLYL